MTRLAPAKQAQRHASSLLRSNRFRHFFNLSASFIFERFVRDTANSLLPASDSVFDSRQYPIDEAPNTYKDFKEVFRSVVGTISEYLSHQLSQ